MKTRGQIREERKKILELETNRSIQYNRHPTNSNYELWLIEKRKLDVFDWILSDA